MLKGSVHTRLGDIHIQKVKTQKQLAKIPMQKENPHRQMVHAATLKENNARLFQIMPMKRNAAMDTQKDIRVQLDMSLMLNVGRPAR